MENYTDYEWSISNEMKATYYMHIDKNNDALLLETDIPHPYRLFIIEKCYEAGIEVELTPDIVFCQALYDLQQGFEEFQRTLGVISKITHKRFHEKRVNRIISLIKYRKGRKEMYPSLEINSVVFKHMQYDLNNYKYYAAYHMQPNEQLIKIAARNIFEEYYRRTYE
jgi:hypothetical protein